MVNFSRTTYLQVKCDCTYRAKIEPYTAKPGHIASRQADRRNSGKVQNF